MKALMEKLEGLLEIGGTKKDIASITESDIVTLNNTYVKLDGVNRDYTGASIILVGDNTFEDGATVVYILNEDNENVVDYIWVIG